MVLILDEKSTACDGKVKIEYEILDDATCRKMGNRRR